ncbi:lysophospholipid acyltransferase family protein [Tatumella sp. UBA2305]|uniref:lysophospholipid acyltransferase family protein n=1 Tax=Tatumella sp. UBA2305 TaxID=1947647 RepID=UPI0039C92923
MTVLCFSLFGIGGLALSLIWFRCLNLFVKEGQARRQLARRSISWCFRVFMKTMKIVGIMDYRFINTDWLKNDRSCLVIANHPSLIDYVMLASVMPDTDCLVKSALQQNFFVKGVIKAADYLINSQSEVLLPTCSERFSAGETLILFPEGTRTVYGQPIKLQRGAANIAVRCQADIRLVTISCTEQMLDKQSPWYRIPKNKPVFHVCVRERINITDFLEKYDNKEPSLTARQLNKYLLQQLS